MSFTISKEDFGSKDHHSYKITCPGNYKLCQNISFNPKKNETVAIIIDSNDVVLDLNGHVLKQSSRSDKSKITGILVVTGHKNVTVLNGTIRNFSQRGLYVEGGNKFITVKDLTITGCGYGTDVALFDGVKGVAQVGLQLGDTEFYQALEIETFKGLIEHLRVENVTASENNFGASLGEGQDYKFLDCDFSRNRDYRLVWDKLSGLSGLFEPKSVISYGLIYLSNPSITPPPNFGIKNVEFSNCRFNSNNADALSEGSEGAYTAGMMFEINITGLKIKNCQFNSNYTLLNESGKYSQSYGLLLGASEGTVIEDSEFSQNNSGNYVAGFNLTGVVAGNSPIPVTQIFQPKSIVLRNCVAANNYIKPGISALTTIPPYSIQALSAVGFMVRYPFGLSMTNCVSENNYAQLPEEPPLEEGPVFSVLADGILIYSDERFACDFANNIEIKSGKMSKNRVLFDCEREYYQNLTASSSGLRIYDDLCENILVEGCFISNNIPGIGENPFPFEDCGKYISAGVDAFNTGLTKTGPSYLTLVNNKIQSNGTHGVYSNLDFTKIERNNIDYQSVGVQLENSFYSSVIDNVFLYNNIAVSDVATENGEPVCRASTNIVAGNKAVKSSSESSFQVLYCSAPVPSCFLYCPPPVATGTLSDFPFQQKLWSNVEISVESQGPIYTDLCVVDQSRSLRSKSVSKFDVKSSLKLKNKLFKY